MSHYAVAVFSDDGDFDRLLAPYGACNKQYCEFFPIEYGEIEKNYKKFKKLNRNRTIDDYIKIMRYEVVDGQWGSYSNPNGRWDFYSLNGKAYLFDVKDGSIGDPVYRKNDYIWFPDMKDAEEDAREYWDDFVGESALGEAPGIFDRQYFIDRYKTREQYIKEMTRVMPYAFITPDGVWHSAGRIFYFGLSNETAEDADRYAEEWDAWINSDANPYVNLVDCHI